VVSYASTYSEYQSSFVSSTNTAHAKPHEVSNEGYLRAFHRSDKCWRFYVSYYLSNCHHYRPIKGTY
jgi:hypothetical protein